MQCFGSGSFFISNVLWVKNCAQKDEKAPQSVKLGYGSKDPDPFKSLLPC
jgi:hypothetical protein